MLTEKQAMAATQSLRGWVHHHTVKDGKNIHVETSKSRRTTLRIIHENYDFDYVVSRVDADTKKIVWVQRIGG